MDPVTLGAAVFAFFVLTLVASALWDCGFLVVMAAAVIVLVCSLSGCARLPESVSADLLRENETSCAANPRAMPGCVVGVFIYGRWRF